METEIAKATIAMATASGAVLPINSGSGSLGAGNLNKTKTNS